jgi:hypothetical protein
MKNYKKLYEELRQAIDGGYALATHEDALEFIREREWVGLTEEEIKECFAITPDQFLPWQIYKRIETKLKEKNT